MRDVEAESRLLQGRLLECRLVQCRLLQGKQGIASTRPATLVQILRSARAAMYPR